MQDIAAGHTAFGGRMDKVYRIHVLRRRQAVEMRTGSRG
jgi:hypothetical protein